MATNASMPTPVSWKVTAQAETTKINPTGNVIDGIEVDFQLSDGTAGSVFIPLASYSVDTVREAVSAKAADMSSVAGLTGTL